MFSMKKKTTTRVLNYAVYSRENQIGLDILLCFLPLFSLSPNANFSERPSLTIPSLSPHSAFTTTCIEGAAHHSSRRVCPLFCPLLNP